MSGIFDGYYDFSDNHPESGDNQVRNFDLKADQASLTMAKITLAHDPSPVGIRVDAGLGQAFQIAHPSNPSGGPLKYIEQMYVSLKPQDWKGLEVDFGQFVTSAGAEVNESNDDWNYSRSLLFALACPYYHFGLRTSLPVNPTTAVGVQVVNGWNDLEDNNSGKTVGLTFAQTKRLYTLNTNYYVGPENSRTDYGFRNFFDTTVVLMPLSNLNAYLNYDYGQNRNANATRTGTVDLVHWQGVAGALHYAPTTKTTVTARAEYYSDNNGFTSGLAQDLHEVTFTADHLVYPGMLARMEYRHDGSDHSFFNHHNDAPLVQGQSTFEVALVAFFGPKT